MINTKLKLVALLLVVCLSLAFGYSAQTSAFDLFGDTCSKAADSAVCKANGTGRDSSKNNTNKNVITDTIKTAANIVAALAGIAAVFMIILGGFRYVTSGGIPGGQRSGDASGVKSAQTMITNAIVGLVIVALAWTITRFITDKLIQ